MENDGGVHPRRRFRRDDKAEQCPFNSLEDHALAKRSDSSEERVARIREAWLVHFSHYFRDSRACRCAG